MRVACAAVVGPGELRVRSGAGLLTCVGVRTGVCLCLYDPVGRIGGMAHVLHGPFESANDPRPGAHADQAVPLLIDGLERVGADRGRLEAALAGGADVRVRADAGAPLVFEASVIHAVLDLLHAEGIKVVARDLGGIQDRLVTLDISLGRAKVRAGEDHRALCEFLTGTPSLRAA